MPAADIDSGHRLTAADLLMLISWKTPTQGKSTSIHPFGTPCLPFCRTKGHVDWPGISTMPDSLSTALVFASEQKCSQLPIVVGAFDGTFQVNGRTSVAQIQTTAWASVRVSVALCEGWSHLNCKVSCFVTSLLNSYITQEDNSDDRLLTGGHERSLLVAGFSAPIHESSLPDADDGDHL